MPSESIWQMPKQLAASPFHAVLEGIATHALPAFVLFNFLVSLRRLLARPQSQK